METELWKISKNKYKFFTDNLELFKEVSKIKGVKKSCHYHMGASKLRDLIITTDHKDTVLSLVKKHKEKIVVTSSL